MAVQTCYVYDVVCTDCVHFDVEHFFIYHALDCFAQLFIEPLMKKSSECENGNVEAGVSALSVALAL